MASSSKTTKATPPKNNSDSPSTLTLQWLSYALWGWLGIALAALSVITLDFYLNSSSSLYDEVAYPMSAVLILLSASLVVDLFYSSREDINSPKTGVSSLISIVHTVIFALGAIASLVVAVFSAINILASLEGGSSFQANLYTFLITAVFYTVATVRVALFKNPLLARRIGRIVLIVIPAILLIFSISGPLVRQVQTKQDRLIEASISDINYAIEQYSSINHRLPQNLTDLTFTSGSLAAEAIKQNLIDYHPGTRQQDKDNYFYQLCTTYRFARNSQGEPEITLKSDDNYLPYPDTYTHPKGDVCYKLYTPITNANSASDNSDNAL